MDIKARAQKVMRALERRYPRPRSALNWERPWELLVATVLSAQCTDERVNKVLPDFFRNWPGPRDLALSGREEVEKVIYSTGFYRNKASNLRKTAKIVWEEYSGEVPKTMSELTALPGVARKTANIVLFSAWGINAGIAVDTHVKRISMRLGLTQNTDPNKVEKDLMGLFPRDKWGDVNHAMVLFGREVCTAKNPACPECEMRGFCPWPEKK